MAIGFVFELDDVLYPAIVSRMDRSAYENSPPPKGTPLSVGGAPTLCGGYVWLLALFDVGMMIYIYRRWIFPAFFEQAMATLSTNQLNESYLLYWQVATLCLVHTVLYGLAAVHFQLHARMSTSGLGGALGTLGFALKALLSLGLLFGTYCLTYYLGYLWIAHSYGSSTSCIEAGSQLDTCINAFGASAACSADGLLSIRADPNSTAPIYMTYSYADDIYYSMRLWGPVQAGCLPPGDRAAHSA